MRIQIVDFRDDEAFPPTVSRHGGEQMLRFYNSTKLTRFICFYVFSGQSTRGEGGGGRFGVGGASLSGQDVCLFVCVTPSNPHFQTCREVLMRGSEPATCFSTADSD